MGHIKGAIDDTDDDATALKAGWVGRTWLMYCGQLTLGAGVLYRRNELSRQREPPRGRLGRQGGDLLKCPDNSEDIMRLTSDLHT